MTNGKKFLGESSFNKLCNLINEKFEELKSYISTQDNSILNQAVNTVINADQDIVNSGQLSRNIFYGATDEYATWNEFDNANVIHVDIPFEDFDAFDKVKENPGVLIFIKVNSHMMDFTSVCKEESNDLKIAINTRPNEYTVDEYNCKIDMAALKYMGEHMDQSGWTKLWFQFLITGPQKMICTGITYADDINIHNFYYSE